MMRDLGNTSFAPMSALHAEAAEPETVHVLALRVDFSKDTAGNQTTGDGHFDMRAADSAKVAVDPPPHDRAYIESHFEALRRYYDVQTNHGLVIQTDVYPQEADSVFHLSDTVRYGPWFFSVSNDSILTRAERIVRDSIHLADSLDSSIRWNRYQSFIVFHAGADFQGDVNQDTPYDIPSFNLALGESLEVRVAEGRPDSAKVNLVMIVPETVSQDDFTGAMNGVLAHEFGHQLGFFDLYDVMTGLPVDGVFSLMDSGESMFGTIADPYDSTRTVAVRGILPASIDPWHKLIFPFFRINLEGARDGDTASLRAVLLGNDLIYVPVHLGEYFIAENRPIDYNGDGTVILKADPATGVILGPEPAVDSPSDTLATRDYDFLLPGPGTLIWHIDENAAIAGLINIGGVNVFSDRRGVLVEEADGIRDIGSASAEFFGGPLDPYFVGGYTKLGPDTTPNSNSNDNTATGITLEVLDPPGLTMRLRMGTPEEVPGWPIVFHGAPAREGINAADLDGDGNPETILISADSTLIAANAEDGTPLWGVAFGDSLTTGAAVAQGQGADPTIMIRAGGIAYWFHAGSGEAPLSYSDVRVSAGPIPDSALVVVGCADGRVRAMSQQGDIAWTFPTGAAGDSITAIASGTGGAEAIRVAAGTGSGRVFAGGSDLATLAGWPTDPGGGAVRSLLLLRAPLRYEDPPRDLILIGKDRSVDLRDAGGRSIHGWPKSLPDTLAGEPAVGDLLGDGVLKVAATTRGGEILLWDLSGMDVPHWPRSVWEPDRRGRPLCVSGPRFWQIGTASKIYLVQLRGDGIQMAMDADGRPVDLLPHATGALGIGGPVRLKGSFGSERWYFLNGVADSCGVSAVDFGNLNVADDVPGTYAGPGGGTGRSGIYGRALVPIPLAAEADLVETTSVIMHPNPVRDGILKIHYVLGERATMDAEAIDLSGRPRAHTRWEGLPGAAGQTYAWNLGSLASGPYVIRLNVRGERHSRSMTRVVAIVR